MQEEVTQKTIALTVQCVKITGRLLAKAMLLALRQGKKKHSALHYGKQTMKQLSRHNAELSSIEKCNATRPRRLQFSSQVISSADSFFNAALTMKEP